MAYPSNTDTADDLLRSGYERWQRLEEAKKDNSADLKELFAELKASGFDGKALRVAFREVATKDDTKKQELGAVVELYVTSLLRVGTLDATRRHAARETPTDQRGGQADATDSMQEASAENSRPGGSGFTTPSAGTGGDEDRQPIPGDDDGDHGSDDQPAAEPVGHAGGAVPEPVARPHAAPVAVPTAGHRTQAAGKVDHSKPNPICQDPEECGITGSWEFTCLKCLAAAKGKAA